MTDLGERPLLPVAYGHLKSPALTTRLRVAIETEPLLVFVATVLMLSLLGVLLMALAFID